MYNKPITQRVAYARSKKPSALKQTEDTTVLKTEKIPVIDTLFKTEVIDNYRWLEDDRSPDQPENRFLLDGN